MKEAEQHQIISHFDADSLIGTNIDVFQRIHLPAKHPGK